MWGSAPHFHNTIINACLACNGRNVLLQVLKQVREKLRLPCAPVQIPIGLEHEHRGLVDLLDMQAMEFGGDFGQNITQVCWEVMMLLLEMYSIMRCVMSCEATQAAMAV